MGILVADTYHVQAIRLVMAITQQCVDVGSSSFRLASAQVCIEIEQITSTNLS
jgi:hypothetical protein